MAFYISGPKLLFETTENSTHPNSTQQESNYIYIYTTKFGTSITIRLNRKFDSTEFETMRVDCISLLKLSTVPYAAGTKVGVTRGQHGYISMSNSFPSLIVHWILNFVGQPTHENHENF